MHTSECSGKNEQPHDRSAFSPSQFLRLIKFGRVAITSMVLRTLRGAHSNYWVHARAKVSVDTLLRVVVSAAIGSVGDTKT